LRSPGSTASAKNADPTSVGEPGAVASGFHVAPPSSLRTGPTPRYVGSADTIRLVNKPFVSASPVPTYTRSGSAGSMAMAPHALLRRPVGQSPRLPLVEAPFAQQPIRIGAAHVEPVAGGQLGQAGSPRPRHEQATVRCGFLARLLVRRALRQTLVAVLRAEER